MSSPPPPTLIAEIWRILRPGGIWINYGPAGPEEALRRFTPTELAELGASSGFDLVEATSHRTSFLALPEPYRPRDAWSVHLCHLAVFARDGAGGVAPSRAAAEPASLDSGTVLAHFHGAVMEQALPQHPDGGLRFRHERIPGRPERFEIGPRTAAALALVDGRTTLGTLSRLLVSSGIARSELEATETYAALCNAGLLALAAD